MSQYWFNVRTHEVEKDAQSGWQSLIGPYESRAEAEQALAKVRERNDMADALDEDENA
ncbi:SPOR domain-containing protein [Arthrobacter polaris]|uniref:SPOR domain-containing protein n=1 Tax=Arthrobacter polaris TaxID=2813727 RepID=UPI001F267E92|nr:SPOR domain-containing protein [Arthrobacter polaris]UIK89685.1 SPOR domain-containing protein [Arthrobacter polaris]